MHIRLTTGKKKRVPKSEKTLRTQIANAEKKKKDRKRKYTNPSDPAKCPPHDWKYVGNHLYKCSKCGAEHRDS